MERAENAKFGKLNDACKVYGMGRTNLRAKALEAGALYKPGGLTLVNYEKFDKYLEQFRINQGA